MAFAKNESNSGRGHRGKGHRDHHKHHHSGHVVAPLAVATTIPAPVHGPFVPTGPETRVTPVDGVVHLPANASLQDIHTVGPDLVVQLPDGSHILIVDGAVTPPQLVIGDVEVPQQNLAALIVDSEVLPAAGANASAGGNFEVPPGVIGPGFPISPLLPPTELNFSIPQFTTAGVVFGGPPGVIIVPSNGPAPNPTDVTVTVDEAGLPLGSHPGSGETVTGDIIYTASNQPATLTINGQAPTVGETFVGTHGTLTITSVAPGDVGFSYTLTSAFQGSAATSGTVEGIADQFATTVTDSIGQSASAHLTVDVVDDVPTARADVTDDGTSNFSAIAGNVISAAGDTNTGGADTLGADRPTNVTGIAAGGSATTFTTVGASGTTITTSEGSLTIHEDGSYTYTRAAGTPGGVTDVFTYQITDSDGATSTTTLTINIGNATPTVTVPQEGSVEGGTLVNEAGIAVIGSHAGDGSATTTGQITYTPGDAPDSISIGGHTLTGAAGQVITGTHGTLTILSVDTVNHVVDYSYTLTTPITETPAANNGADNEGAGESFAVVVTDTDGSQATGTLKIDVIDDVPTANPDTNSVVEGVTLTVASSDAADVLHNDVPGADGFKSGGGVIGVEAGSNTSDVVTTGVNTAITTSLGTLTLQADGSYTYTAKPGTEGGVDHFVYTIQDGDGDTSTTTLDITVNSPTVSVGSAATTISEEVLPIGTEHSGDTDNDSANDVLTQSGSVALNDTISGSTFTTTLGVPSGTYTSGGNAISWAVSPDGHTLTGTINGGATTILTVTIDNTGHWTTTLSGPFDDPTGNGENNVVVTVPVGGVDNFGNAASSGSIAITVEDDSPVALASAVNGSVDEDGLVTPSTGEAGDGAGQNVVSGSVTGLFNVGADQPGTYHLLADTSGLPALTSDSVALVYSVSGNTLTATAGAGGPTVFTLVLNPTTGAYTFTLDAPLDHPTGNGENTLAINFGSVIQVTDFDGDSATAQANGTTTGLVITVVDDVPSATGGLVSASVDEDGLVTPATGEAGDGAGQNVATGSVTGLFHPGADTPLTYSLSAVTSGLPALTSDSVAVVYSVSGNTLTATAGPSGPTVFTLVLNPTTGAYTFTLDAPLDHPTGMGENTLAINFGSIITATDHDGDSVTATATGSTAGFVVTVVDDVPSADGGLVSASVDEDGLVSPGNGGTTGDGAGQNVATGSVASLFHPGADVPLTYSLSASTSGLPALTADGHTVTYAVSGNTLTASASGIGTVFTLVLDPTTGNYTFTLDHALDHPAGNGENTLAINFGSIITATDHDGDSVTATVASNANGAATAGFVVTVVDDTPIANPDTNSDFAGQTLTVVAADSNDVLHNDIPGADGFKAGGGVLGVEANNHPADVVTTGVNTAITTSLGTLTLQADGSYTYAAKADVSGTDVFTYTIEDADGDTSTTTLTITVNADNPIIGSAATTISEEVLPNGTEHLGDTDSDAANDVLTQSGSVSLTDPVSGSTFVTTLGIPAGTYTSGGHAISWAVSPDGHTLTGTINSGATTILTVTLDNTGHWTTTLSGPFDDPTGNGENSVLVNVPVSATDNHGNSTLTNGTIAITVEDDSPVALAAAVTGSVDEDGLVTPATGQAGDGAGQNVVSGSVTGLFNVGADQPGTYHLLANTSGLPALTSDSVALVYSVSGNTLTATAGASGPTVFTLVLNPTTGAYTFTLDAPLDHPTGNGENTLAINFGSIIQVTDFDGDSATAQANGTTTGLVITVVDDVPSATGALVSASVDEDGLVTPSTGEAGDGAGQNVATGSVTGLFHPGADVPLTYSLSAVTSGLPALTSDSVAVVYSVSGNTLTATAGPGGPTVFTLVLNPTTGAYTFTLDAPLDHPAGMGENTLAINFGSIITATDHDGDSVTATATGSTAGFVVTVVDDVPSATGGLVSASVDEDGLVTPATGETGDGAGQNIATGSVTGLFHPGADVPLTYSLSAVTSGLPALTSDSVAVVYSVSGNTLTATAGPSGPTVFTLVLNPTTGAYTFTLDAPLDHPAGMGENSLTINFGSIITATDHDGDSVTATATGSTAGFVVTVVDDVPSADGGLVSASVDEDGLVSPGNGGTTGDGAGQNIATGSVSSLFHPGADVPLTYSLSATTSGLPALTVDGHTVTYAVSGNTLTASATGVGTVFTLVLDPTTGNYTFTLDHALDHPAGNGENTLAINFGSIITATDHDGDSVTATATGSTAGFVVTVVDDTPIANPDTNGVFAGQTLTVLPGDTADVLHNDVPGADGYLPTGGVIGVEAGGSLSDVVTTGVNTAITTSLGTLTLQADGSYTYVAKTSVSGVDVFTYTIEDADGDTSTSTLTITVSADNPIIGSTSTTISEEVLPNGTEHLGDTDSDAANDVLTQSGSVSLTDPVSGSSFVTTLGVPAGTYTSGGHAISWAVSPDGHTLTGTINSGATTILTVTLDNTGHWTTTLSGPFDDPTGNGENSVLVNVPISATDNHGNPTLTNGTIAITVEDDSPVAVATVVNGSVDEDGLVTPSTGEAGDGAGQNVVSGSVTSLFTVGADQPGTYSLLSNTSGLPALTSDSVALVYHVSGNTLTATAGASGPTVFTLSLNATTGAYTFTLDAPLDHPAGNGENTLTINFGSIIQVTDFDGDTATAQANGTTTGLVITVVDDVPSATGALVSASVDEDGLVTPSTGETGDGAGQNIATGSVTGLFHPGADVPLTYSLSAVTSGLPALTSDSVAVVYSVSGNTLTATAGPGGPTVFTLVLNPTTGAYTFTLDAPLDHPAGGGENTLAINFGSIITATDHDGDSVTATATGSTAGFVVTVVDDVPSATGGLVSASVDEDGLVQPDTVSVFGGGTTGDGAGQNIATGSVTALFHPGADVPLTYSLSAVTSGLPSLTSDGHAVTYAVSGNTLTASATGVGTVFTLVLNPTTGAYTFTLDHALDHPAGNGENSLTINFGSIIQATDHDGDTVTSTATGTTAGLVVTVVDDVPGFNAAIDNGTHSDHPADPATVGNLHFFPGADTPPTITSISDTGDLNLATSPPTSITPTVGGVPVATSFNGTDTLTGYLDNNHDGVFDAGDTTVYTVKLALTGGTGPGEGTWTFTLDQPLDGGLVTNTVGGGSSFGAGPTGSQELTAGTGTSTVTVGLLAGFDTGVNATTLDLSGATAGGVNGSTAGWGINSNNFTAGQEFLLSFFDADVGDGGTHGVIGATPANYVPPAGFSTPVTDTVTIAFPHFKVGDTIEYKVTYGDPNGSGSTAVITHVLTATDISTGFAINAPLGENIDYIQIYDVSGSGKFQVVSTGTISSLTNDQLNFSTTISDADGDTTTSTFHVTVSGPATPIVLDLNGDGVRFVGMSAGNVFNYGSGVMATAWAAPGDGVLALNSNGHLVVNFSQYVAGAASDLQGLAAFDTNHDGKLDAGDANFSKFGVIVNGHFETLAQAGISSINLSDDGKAYTAAGGQVQVSGSGVFTYANGKTGAFANASFSTGPVSGSSGTTSSTSGGIAANENVGLTAAAAAAAGLIAAGADLGLGHNPAAAGGVAPVSGEVLHTTDIAPTLVSTGGDLVTPLVTQETFGSSLTSMPVESGHPFVGGSEFVQPAMTEPLALGGAGGGLGSALLGASIGAQGPMILDQQDLPAIHTNLFVGAGVVGQIINQTASAPHVLTTQVAQVISDALPGVAAAGPTLANLIESLPGAGGASLPLLNLEGGQAAPVHATFSGFTGFSLGMPSFGSDMAMLNHDGIHVAHAHV